MNDPHQVRLNTADNPGRTAALTALEERFGIDSPHVIRKLIDAYIAYAEEHDRPPSFPVVLIPAEDFAILAEKAGGAYRTKGVKPGKKNPPARGA